MHLSSEAEETAEVHNQRAPAHRVDMGAWTVSKEKILVDVQLHNMRFKHVSVHILPERPEVMHDALQVWPICPGPSMQLQPNHHAEDIGARLGDPSGFNVLMSTTGVPK